jgi:hypothetical protein
MKLKKASEQKLLSCSSLLDHSPKSGWQATVVQMADLIALPLLPP